jgi:hypothetical protein
MDDTILIGTVVVTLLLSISILALAVLGKLKLGVHREVIVGAVSSILAALIIWSTSTILTKVIIPWHYQHSYKGLDLSGKWRVTAGPDGIASSSLQMTAEIKQITERISGVLVAVFMDNSNRRPLTYSLNGLRRDQFLALTIEKVSRKQTGIGTSLVEVTDVGNRLKGYLCLYDPSIGQLRCDSSEWTRIDNEE